MGEASQHICTAWQQHCRQQQRRQAGMQALLQRRIAATVEQCFDGWRALVAARRERIAVRLVGGGCSNNNNDDGDNIRIHSTCFHQVAASYAEAKAAGRDRKALSSVLQGWTAWVTERRRLQVSTTRMQARSQRRLLLQIWQVCFSLC